MKYIKKNPKYEIRNSKQYLNSNKITINNSLYADLDFPNLLKPKSLKSLQFLYGFGKSLLKI